MIPKLRVECSGPWEVSSEVHSALEVKTTTVENGFVNHLAQLDGRILEVGSPSRFSDRASLEPIVSYQPCSSMAMSCFVSNDRYSRTQPGLFDGFRRHQQDLVQSTSTFKTRKHEFGESLATCISHLGEEIKRLASS